MKKSRFKLISSLTVLLGSFVYTMIYAIINGILGHFSAIAVSVFGAIGIAKLLGENITLSYEMIVIIIIGCGLLRGILRYIEQYLNHYIAFKLLAIIRNHIFIALRKLYPQQYINKKKGDLISMITSDVETLEVFFAHSVSPLFIAIVVSSTVTIFIGLIANWYIAIIALLGYIILGVIMPIIGDKVLKKDGVLYRDKLSAFNSYFIDSIKGVNDIVLNNANDIRKKEVRTRSMELTSYSERMSVKSNLLVVITNSVISFIVSLILLACIYMIYQDKMTIGITIITLTTLLSSFGPVIALSNLPSSLNQTFASANRITNLIDESKEVVKAPKEKKFCFEKLEVEDLTFSYDDNNEVLNDFNFSIKVGQIIGIKGKSGSGKSTLLKILMGFLPADSGKVKYNSIDINEINTTCLLENVTMLNQQTYLFSGTIEENLKIAKPDATIEQIIESCKQASIHELITSLPEQYNTNVGSLGSRFSTGEKQRIGLARVFLRSAPLILLDEPTSNVDSINEGIILKALKDNKAGKAIIIVSHRDSTLSIADNIYMM